MQSYLLWDAYIGGSLRRDINVRSGFWVLHREVRSIRGIVAKEFSIRVTFKRSLCAFMIKVLQGNRTTSIYIYMESYWLMWLWRLRRATHNLLSASWRSRSRRCNSVQGWSLRTGEECGADDVNSSLSLKVWEPGALESKGRDGYLSSCRASLYILNLQ